VRIVGAMKPDQTMFSPDPTPTMIICHQRPFILPKLSFTPKLTPLQSPSMTSGWENEQLLARVCTRLPFLSFNQKCQTTDTFKALKEIQSTNPNPEITHWLHAFFTTRLLKEFTNRDSEVCVTLYCCHLPSVQWWQTP